MPRQVILLSGSFEAGLIGPFLSTQNPGCRVRVTESLEGLEASFDAALAEDPLATRLVAFCTSVIVPARLLARLPGPAYNIHPGPPGFPGRHPESWGAYAGVGRFGATLHEMAPRVDAGPIVDVAWFNPTPGSGQIAYGMGALRAGLELIRRWAQKLAADMDPLPHNGLMWSGIKTTHADLEAMCRVPPDIDPAELERRRRAFAEQAGSVLTVAVGGLDFRWIATAPSEPLAPR
jgi:methionyl-tRNA formyltransferase